MSKMIFKSIYLRPSQREGIYALSDATRIPAAVLIREGLDMLIKASGVLDFQPPVLPAFSAVTDALWAGGIS